MLVLQGSEHHLQFDCVKLVRESEGGTNCETSNIQHISYDQDFVLEKYRHFDVIITAGDRI